MMTCPPVSFLMFSTDGYVDASQTAERVPLRVNRTPREDNVSGLTYGDYFRTIAAVLAGNDHQELRRAISGRLHRAVSSADMDGIRIFAEKHGGDYHPARIEVQLGQDRIVFVMNVAATDRGRSRLASEFNVLKHLNKKYGHPYLPQVFFQHHITGTSTSRSQKPTLAMFLGEWFEGYHEFHLSKDVGTDGASMVLWDRHRGNRMLQRDEARQIYREAARIMTLYYDIETFEQIFPWHHAAGDFVVSLSEATPRVRLITARQYGPMLDPEQGVSVEEGLLFFLLNLSLRMRLDRFNGTGAVAWAEASCVEATIDGFLRGLEQQQKGGRIPNGSRTAFFAYCRLLGREDIAERCLALVDACDPRAPDIAVLRANLDQHVAALCCALESVVL